MTKQLFLIIVCNLIVFYKPACIFASGASSTNAQTESADARWQAMSEQEKQQIQNEINQTFLLGRLSIGLKNQLTIISAIEQQIAKLRAAVESFPEDVAALQNIPEADRIKYREQISKAVQERQLAITGIDSQLAKLKPASTPVKETETTSQVNELKEIRQLAVKEKALDTVKRLDSFIAKYQQPDQQQTQPSAAQQTAPRPSRPQDN
jgi:hypothetical protein